MPKKRKVALVDRDLRFEAVGHELLAAYANRFIDLNRSIDGFQLDRRGKLLEPGMKRIKHNQTVLRRQQRKQIGIGKAHSDC